MYELRFHPQVDKELEQLPLEVRGIIKTCTYLQFLLIHIKQGKDFRGYLKVFGNETFANLELITE